jgi:HlyD family secretion protein
MAAMKFWVPVALAIPLLACGCDRHIAGPSTTQPAEPESNVIARGTVIAAERNALVAPHSRSSKPFVIAWVVADGSRVGAGETVVRFDLEIFEHEVLRRRVEVVEAETALAMRERELQAKSSSVARDMDVVSSQRKAAARLHSAGDLVASRMDRSDSVDDLAFLEAKQKSLQSSVDDLASDADSDLGVLRERLKIAQAMLRRAESDIAGAEIRAPHPGIINLERNWAGEPIRVGDSTFAGKRVATLSSTSRVRALVHVPEIDAHAVAPGAPVTVRVTGETGSPLRATVLNVSENAARVNATDPVRYFAVELNLASPSAQLLPGRSVIAKFDDDVSVNVPSASRMRRELTRRIGVPARNAEATAATVSRRTLSASE